MLPIETNQLTAIVPHVQFPASQRHTATNAVDDRLFCFAIKRIDPEHVAMRAIQREYLTVPGSNIHYARAYQGRAGDTIARVKRPHGLPGHQIERPQTAI